MIEGFAKGALPAYAHYLTPTQASLWRQLAESFRTRASGDAAFDAIFQTLAAELARRQNTQIELIALGAADARKESRLAATLTAHNFATAITLVDISSDLINQAIANLTKSNPQTKVLTPYVADIAANDLADLTAVLLASRQDTATRVVTLFGVLPALESKSAFDFATALLGPNDYFIFSANLLPDQKPISEVAAFYDSPLARNWLQQVLREVKFAPELEIGTLNWQLTASPGSTALHATHTVRALITPARDVRPIWGQATAEVPANKTIEVFRSHRHSSTSVRDLADSLRLEIADWQASPSGEEGVALTRVRA